MKIRRRSWSLLAALALVLSAAPASAQGVAFTWGGELVTRYVWRGIPYSRVAQAQPWVQATRGPVEVGTWGSYGIDGEYKEQDLWVGYTFGLPQGALKVTLNDYFFTSDFSNYFDWGGAVDDSVTGAHTLELVADYEGPDAFPLKLQLASTVYNDPSPSVYGEVGYGLSALGLDWSAAAGAVLADGAYYAMGEGAVTNLALNVSRTLVSFGNTALYGGAWAIHNPDREETYFVLVLGF